MVVRELITKLGFQTDTSGVDQADTSVSGFFKNLNVKSLMGAGALLAVGKALFDIGKQAIGAAADMEMLTTQFEVMLGSSKEADKMMGELNKFAASTPFALDTLAKGSQQLLAFGVKSEDVIKRMRMLGDTAGGNAEKLNGLILAYGKVQTKGKASLEEINMMAERGLPIYDILAKRMNTSKEGLFKLISKGKVGAADVTAALEKMTMKGGMFFKGMEKQSLTFNGMVSTMKDNFTLALAAAGKGMLPLAKDVVGFITTIAQQLGPILTTIFKVVQTVLQPILKVLMAVLGPIISVLSTVFMILGSVVDVISSVTNAIFDLFSKYIAKPLNYIADLFRTLAPFIEGIAKKAVEYIGAIFQKVEKVIDEFIAPVATYLIALFSKIGKNILKVSKTIWEYLKPVFNFLRIVITLVVKIWMWLIGILVDYVIASFKFFINILTTVYDWLMSWIIPALQTLGNFFSWIGKIIYDKLAPAFKWLGGIFDWIGEKLGAVFDWIAKKVASLLKFFGVSLSGDTEIKKTTKVKMPSSSQRLAAGINSKTTNVSMKNTINMKGSGKDKNDMKKIAESIFTIQLKQVLTDAGV